MEITRDDVSLLETLLGTMKEWEGEIGGEDPTALSEAMTDTASLIARMKAALPR